MHLSPILARFAAAHPDLELRIDYADRARDLAREGFDIGIRIGAARGGALTARKLCEDRQIVVASPDSLARHGTPETTSHPGDHPVIGYIPTSTAETRRFPPAGRKGSP